MDSTYSYRKFRRNIGQLNKGERDIVLKAYGIARNAHRGQKKFGIYPYIIHPLSVFNFLFQDLEARNIDLLVSALLHDVLEDTDVSRVYIKKHFGGEVVKILKAVTRTPDPKEGEAERSTLKRKHFDKYIRNGSREVRLLGIADKYDNIKNIRHIKSGNPHFIKFDRWLKEGELFLKLAARTNKKTYRLLKRELVVSKNYAR